MKFIKYAVGLVIALSVIPLVVVTVNNLDTPKLKTVEFEVLDVDGKTITFSDNTYTNINNSAVFDDSRNVKNIKSLSLNNGAITDFTLYNQNETYNLEFITINMETIEIFAIDNTNVGMLGDGFLNNGDILTVTFEFPVTIPPLVKLFIGFVPLIFVAGVVSYLFVKTNLKKED